MVNLSFSPFGTGNAPHEITLNRILLFGDSITQGGNDQSLGFAISPALQDHYTRKFDVITRGFGGYTSAHGRWMIDPVLKSEHRPNDKAAVELLVVFWGSNDSVVDGHIQNVPIADYLENTRYIIHSAQSQGIKRIILVSPALYDEYRGGPDRTSSRFYEYGQALKTIADEYDIGYINLYDAFLESLGWKEGDAIPGKKSDGSNIDLTHLLPDGLHFSGEGYKIWYNKLVELINKKYPEMDSSRLRQIMPPWDYAPIKELPDCLWK